MYGPLEFTDRDLVCRVRLRVFPVYVTDILSSVVADDEVCEEPVYNLSCCNNYIAITSEGTYHSFL